MVPGALALVQDQGQEKILRTGMTRHAGRACPSRCAALRVLAESIDARFVVELGTSTGFAALWMADALRRPEASEPRLR
jgi:predicted O-methyltransferase YrrM